MCIRVCLYCTVKGLKNQWIIIPVTDYIGNDTAVVEVQNGAEIDLVHRNPLIPLEFCHICEPLFIGLIRTKIPVQQILGYKLRILCLSGAAAVVILNGGLNAFGTANSENTLVVHMNVMIMAELVIDAPVALIRALHVDLLDLLRNLLVFLCPGALLSGHPTMVGCSRNMQQLTRLFNRSTFLYMTFLNGSIQVGLSYL